MKLFVVTALLWSLSLADGVQSPSSWRESREDKSADLQDEALVVTRVVMELSRQVKSGTLDPNILKPSLQGILSQQIARVKKGKQAQKSATYIRLLQAALALTLTKAGEDALQLSLLGHTFVVDQAGNVYSPQQIRSPFIEVSDPFLFATSA